MCHPSASSSHHMTLSLSCGKMAVNTFAFLAAFFIVCCASDPVPLVLWHGMGDSCCNPLSMGHLKKQIEGAVSGIYVSSLEIGGNIIDDELSGFFINANKQVEEVCASLSKDPKLRNGFNVMGFSQGGQFLRALVQRCGNITVHNLISIGGQHQGVFGFPKCSGVNSTLCDIVRKILNIGAYVDEVQKDFVQAEYWQDPFNEDEYRKKCVFLADINQEVRVNPDYKARLSNVSNFVMVKFLADTMVQPKDSEWFGFYKPNQDKEIASLFEIPLYTEDKLGLKHLNDTGRLHFLGSPGDHLRMTEEWFMANLVTPFVNVTYDDVRKPVKI